MINEANRLRPSTVLLWRQSLWSFVAAVLGVAIALCFVALTLLHVQVRREQRQDLDLRAELLSMRLAASVAASAKSAAKPLQASAKLDAATTNADAADHIERALIAAEILCVLLLLAIGGVFWSLRRHQCRRQRAGEARRIAASVFEHSFDAVLIIDTDRRIVALNPAFCRLSGYSREEMIGRRAGTKLTPASQQAVAQQLSGSESDFRDWQIEVEAYRKNGEIYCAKLSVSYVRDEAGVLRYAIAVMADITELTRQRTRLERQAHYDALTGLPNRLLLTQRIDAALDAPSTHGALMAVCYLDLDDFQHLNDNYGQDVGDQILIEIAARLERCADLVGHIGGDEFVLLLHDLDDIEDCNKRLHDVMASVHLPIAASGVALKLTTSIGVTLVPHDASGADGLVRHANQAMHVAKDAGKNRIHHFDTAQERRVRERRAALLELRAAFDRREFVLYYQPKVDLTDRRVVGAEALIRWQHPQRGLMPPGEFLPHIEGSDLEEVFGEWVIANALAQIEHWLQLHAICIPVSVNISAKHLLQPDFPPRLRAMLARHPGLPEHALELEVIETVALDDINMAIAVLDECKRFGVRCALDDFGTGYSSLSYFQRLPVDVLKIDQSFVRNMHSSAADREIVESVVKLAQVFHRSVIAEGVETLQHAQLLQRIGCRFAQGYGIARPMPADQLPDWIQSWERDSRPLAVE